jgi:hypothetical protein
VKNRIPLLTVSNPLSRSVCTQLVNGEYSDINLNLDGRIGPGAKHGADATEAKRHGLANVGVVAPKWLKPGHEYTMRGVHARP